MDEILTEDDAGRCLYTTNRAFLSGLMILSEFTEGPCLFVKNGGKGFDGGTVLKLRGEWMFGQCYACLFVVFQGSLEEHL